MPAPLQGVRPRTFWKNIARKSFMRFIRNTKRLVRVAENTGTFTIN